MILKCLYGCWIDRPATKGYLQGNQEVKAIVAAGVEKALQTGIEHLVTILYIVLTAFLV